MATLSAFSRALARPAVRAAAAARRVVARPSAAQPLAAPSKRAQRGSEFCSRWRSIEHDVRNLILQSLAFKLCELLLLAFSSHCGGLDCFFRVE